MKIRSRPFYIIIVVGFFLMSFMQPNVQGNEGSIQIDGYHDEPTTQDNSDQFMIYYSANTVGTSPNTPRSPDFLDINPIQEPMAASSSIDTEYLILCIDFTDVSRTKTPSYITNIILGSGNTMKDYYLENSYNTYSISGSIATGGWVHSSHPMSYYGADDGDNIDFLNGHPNRIVSEAVTLANPTVNFQDYDDNGDGTIDHVILIHAGYGQEQTGNSNDIWSHYSGVNILVDGVYIKDYALASEFSPMGVIAHECGHDLGLVDLYDTDYSSDGIGDWGIMASGSWSNPPNHFVGYHKILLGWIEPTEYTAGYYPSITLNPIETNDEIVKLVISENEYFLLEYRSTSDGSFDTKLPGSGLLITHVDDSKSTNSEDTHRLVDVEEADNNNELDTYGGAQGQSGDVWVSSINGFTDESSPDANTYQNSPSRWQVNNIGTAGSSITFDVSRIAQYDLVIEKVDYPHLVENGESIKIDARVSQAGTETLTNVQINLDVYYDNYTEQCLVLRNDSAVISSISYEHSELVSWLFDPQNGTGRYIFDIIAVHSMEESYCDNEKIVHTRVVNPIGGMHWDHENEYNTEKNKWHQEIESLLGTGDKFILVNNSYMENVSRYSSYSGNSTWFFGEDPNNPGSGLVSYRNYNSSISTRDSIDLSGETRAYLAFYSKYVLNSYLNTTSYSTSYSGFGGLGGLIPLRQNKFNVYASSDNSTWDLLKSYTSNYDTWHYEYINLGSYLGGDLFLKFEVHLEYSIPAAGLYLDDIWIFDEPFENGTVIKQVNDETIEVGETVETYIKAVNIGDSKGFFGINIISDLEVSYQTQAGFVNFTVNFTNILIVLSRDQSVHLSVGFTLHTGPAGETINATFSMQYLGDASTYVETRLDVTIVEPIDWLMVGIIVGASAAVMVGLAFFISKRKRKKFLNEDLDGDWSVDEDELIHVD